VNFFFIAVVVALIILGLFIFSADNYLKTEAANSADVQGKFTLLLYGCSSPDNLENIAILDREGDPYSLRSMLPIFRTPARPAERG
jgi:hypothetical protein